MSVNFFPYQFVRGRLVDLWGSGLLHVLWFTFRLWGGGGGGGGGVDNGDDRYLRRCLPEDDRGGDLRGEGRDAPSFPGRLPAHPS